MNRQGFEYYKVFRLKFSLNLYLLVSLNDIPYLNVIEVMDVQSAFVTGVNLFHIIFVTFQ